MIEVGSKSDEALSRETVADLFEDVGEAPPCMQDQHPWSATLFWNRQIAADRSPISQKFFHITSFVLFCTRCRNFPVSFWSEVMNSARLLHRLHRRWFRCNRLT